MNTTPFAERLYFFIKEKELVQPGDKICVGLSGGADSVCLLETLNALSKRLGISLCAFHVNHCLRGEESDTDELFAKQLCEKRNIPFKAFRFDVKALAAQNKESVEEAGRGARRVAAAECMKEFGATKTALAHHMDDSAETFLFNMARGTSLSGLKGISAKNGSTIRPLLIFRRREIEDELVSRGIKWRTDSSNLTEEYSRNRLRHNVLPYFEKNINVESVRHMSEAMGDIEEADLIIRQLAAEKANTLAKREKGGVTILNAASEEKNLIFGYMITDAIKTLTKNMTDIKRVHIEQIKGLFRGETGHSLDLPYNIKAEKTYDGVKLCLKDANKHEIKEDSPCKIEVGKRIMYGGMSFESRLIDVSEFDGEVPKKKYTKWFDYDKISNMTCLRHRLSGDYIVSDSDGHRKKLKRYFTDEKIPREERDNIVCLADGNRIIWVVGGRISEDCKVSGDTKRILEISIPDRCESEDEKIRENDRRK